MSHDVQRRTVRDEMTEWNVAQPQRNRRTSDVAQRVRRDHSSHIADLGARLVIVLSAAFGFGCARGASRTDGAARDSSERDAASNACTDDCAATGRYCSFGRCTSMTCSVSEMNHKGVSGCLFYTLQPDNVTADENATTSFLVANPGVYAANVTLEVAQSKSSGGGWTPMQQKRVSAGASVRLPISGMQVTAVGISEKAALRISSDQPVTVAQIESDDVDSVSTSSGGTMVLPLQSLGGLYRAVTYAQKATDDVQATAGSRGGGARLIVVGTKDGTDVIFTPMGTVTNGPNGMTFPAGVPYKFTLDDGDVFQIYSGAEGEDLSGAVVSAVSSAVAVFSGNISTTYGSTSIGVNSADMAHEQMPPLQSWSKSWVAAAMTPQSSIGCTSFFGMNGASVWRVVSAQDGTDVTVAAPGLPAGTQRLDAGEVQTIVAVGSFTVTSNNPILVTQGIDCEPSLSLAVAVDATTFLNSLPIAVPPSFDLQLAIVRKAGTEVDIDETAVPDGKFQSVGNRFEVAVIPLDACVPTDGSGVCTHLIESTIGFAVSLRGMDVGSSFALTVPQLAIGPCDRTVDFCVN
jgi:hypothetical protein